MIHQDKTTEEDIIGTLLIYPQTISTVAAKLKSEYLYSQEIKCVYASILSLFYASIPVDITTVASDLNKKSQLDFIGGAYYLTTLTRSGDINVSSQDYKCLLIHEKYILRELASLGNEITNAVNTASADCFEIIERVNIRTAELSDIRSEKIRSVGEIFEEMTAEIENVIDNGIPTGLMTGLANLDARTGGWQNGNLIVIAARPGMGKTALSLNLCRHPAMENNIPTAFFSMEMTAVELVGRLASAESLISSTDINQKKLSRFELNNLGDRCVKLKESPIYIDDTPALSITELSAKAKKLFYEKKVRLIVVDYLQLMSGTNAKGNRELEIAQISRGLKKLAKELSIPIIALSQLSRKCEERADKRPILSDLRESGAIEQDADIVGFIFRPAEYDLFPEGYEYGTEILETTNLMLFDIAKGRGLKPGEVPLKFYGEFMQVLNYPLHNSTTMNTNNNFLEQ